MADEQIRFGVSLDDGMSGPAHAASASVKDLTKALDAGRERLRGFQAQLASAKALGNIEGYRVYSRAVNDARASVFALGKAIDLQGGPVREQAERLQRVVAPADVARHAIQGVASGVRELGAAIVTGDVRGAVEGMAQATGGLAQSLDLVIPGLGQAASGAIQLGGAIVGGTLGALESLVSESLHVVETNERMRASFEALGSQGAGSGQKTLEFLDHLSTELPQSRAQLAAWTKQYEALGIVDLGELRAQITATASAQAIMGDEGAAAYGGIAKKIRIAVEEHKALKLEGKALKALYTSGLNIGDVAAALGTTGEALGKELKAGTVDAQAFGNALETTLIAKGKQPLAAMGKELGTLREKGRETLDHLFDGIDTAPLTDALESLISLGDQGNASGRAIKHGLTDGINGVIKVMGDGILRAEIFFGRVEIGALEAGVTIGRLETAVERLGLAWGAIKDTSGAIAAAGLPGIGAPIAAERAGNAIAGFRAAVAPAHADGGAVTRPAAGEFLASVQPGERILTREEARTVASASRGGGAANDNGPGPPSSSGVQIGTLHLHIDAPAGVTHAQDLSVAGLTIGLERLLLSTGRG